MSNLHHDQIRAAVREQYAAVAKGKDGRSVGCCGTSAGCGSTQVGYSQGELASLPEGADMGLGCGNPQALAALRPGQTVLDLGCGGGIDCFLAAAAVGPTGKVIGVDMTPEMVSKARANVAKLGAENIDIRLGEIEHLPVADESVDVILSNCVVNLSPDKARVFAEAYRVLEPGGSLSIADVVAIAPLSPQLASDLAAYSGCVSGAIQVTELERLLLDAGFDQIEIQIDERSREFIKDWIPGSGAEEAVASAKIRARRPGVGKDVATGVDSKSEARCCGPTCCT